MNQDKTGRPRRYSLQPAAGFANTELAHGVAQLRELAERVYDQIVERRHRGLAAALKE